MKIFKFFILTFISLLSTVSPISTNSFERASHVHRASETTTSIELTCSNSNSTVNEGNYAYFYAKAYNLTFTSAEISVYYDSNLFTVSTVSNYVSLDSSKGDTFLYNSSIPGEIHITYVLFNNVTKTNGSNLFYFSLRSKSNSIEEDTSSFVDLTVGNCINKDMEDISVNNKGKSITITNYISTSVTKVNFDLVGPNNGFYPYEPNDITLVYNSYTKINCGEFRITYDPDQVVLNSYNFLDLENVFLKDINTTAKGLILLSFVSMEDITKNFNFISFNFTPLLDVGETFSITVECESITNSSNANIACDKKTYSFSVVEKPILPSTLSLTSESYSYDDKDDINMTLGFTANQDIGAMDIILTFDPKVLTYNSHELIKDSSYMLGVNVTKVSEGRIQVSILSLNGLLGDYEFVHFVFTPVDLTENVSTNISLSAIDVVTPTFEELSVETISTSFSIAPHKHNLILIDSKDATCSESGYIKEQCSDCNEIIITTIPATGDHINTETIYDYENGIKFDYCHDCKQKYNHTELVTKDYVAKWVDDYMYMDTISLDDVGSGNCLGENGYYQVAKKALIELEIQHSGAMRCLYEEFKDAFERFNAWAIANGENVDYMNGVINQNFTDLGYFAENTLKSNDIILFLALATISVVMTLMSVIKKRKALIK